MFKPFKFFFTIYFIHFEISKFDKNRDFDIEIPKVNCTVHLSDNSCESKFGSNGGIRQMKITNSTHCILVELSNLQK